MKDKKIVFVGGIWASARALEMLIREGYNVVHVFTYTEKMARNISGYEDLRPICDENGISMTRISSTNTEEFVSMLKNIEPDLLLVLGWSSIIHKDALRIPKYGAVGWHPAPLPRGRGRASANWPIIMGEKEWGMTLFFLDEGVDSGPIISQRAFPISERETCDSLLRKAIDLGIDMLKEVLPDILSGNIRGIEQKGRPLYLAKRTKWDGYIDWTETRKNIDALIRATTHPYPGAYTLYKGDIYHIWASEIPEETDMDYVGFPGQVVEIYDDGTLLILCGDGPLHIIDHEIPLHKLKKDDRLGITPRDLVRIYRIIYSE